jgi:hypothetical protein
MAETTITESISRLAPYREEYEKALLQSLMGTAGPEGITGGIVSTPMDIPEIKVAPIAQETLDAYALARAGLGAYQPYMTAAQQAMGQVTPGLTTAGGTIGTGTTAALAGIPQLQQGAATLGAAQPYVGTAGGTMAGALQAIQAGQGQYTPTAGGIQQFMDPYQQLVTQEALKQMQREADVAQQQLSAGAVKAGAFGGGREGVQRAELARNLQDIKSQRIAEDLQKNYQQALAGSMDAYQAARARDIASGQAQLQTGMGQAGLAETLGQLGTSQAAIGGQYGTMGGIMGALGAQQAGLAQAYQDLASGQVALGGAGQGFLGQDVGVLESMGSNLQKQQQLALDAARQTAMQQAYEPYQRIGYASDIMRGLPSVQSTVGTTTAPSPSPMSQALGAGIAGLGVYGVLSGQPWATGGSGTSGAGSLFNMAGGMMGAR